MSRNKKIIISITGIVIVVLTLVGFTYAYFVTQIQGNESEKSIKVSTANLRLTYSDGNGTIAANNIMPGTTTESKIFTVKNNGNNIVGNYKVYLENVINTFTNTNDIVINMTCSSDIENKTCVGLENFTFPTTNDVLVSNSINVGETQTYSLTITYKETGVDQSVDMNKTISGKIQIYDARNIVDISGSVSDAANGDYVEFHSDPKKSQINNKKEYKITAVEPGEHTFYIKSSNGSIKGSKTIVISRANMVNHTDTNIDITEDTSEIKMNVTSIQENLGVEIDNIILNPYSYNSNLLTYNIINNAQLNKNRTTYEPTPITTPGQSINAVYSYEPNYYESDFITTYYCLTTAQQEYYWTYADSFNFDKSSGKFSLVNPKTCKYSECYKELIGKYVISYDIGTNSSTTNVQKPSGNLDSIYKVNGSTLSCLDYKRLNNIPDSAERTISKTEDDYGDSYYFRGDVKDNYLNFNGMCWRVVRIAGDGSIKLILEDKNTTCNSETYTGNYEYANAVYGYKTIKSNNEKMVYIKDFLNYNDGLYDKLKEFQINKMSGVLDKLKKDELCYNETPYENTSFTTSISDLTSYYNSNKSFYYSAYKTMNKDLKCRGTKISKYKDESDIYVGLLTADELTFAGSKYPQVNYNFYLMNNWGTNRKDFPTISLYNFNGSYDMNYIIYADNGRGGYSTVNTPLSVRLTLVLKPNITINSGDGTRMNPYEIK